MGTKGYIRYCNDGGSLVVRAHCYIGDSRQFLRLEHTWEFDESKGVDQLSSKTERQLINIGIIFLETFGVTSVETEQVFDGL